MTKPAIVVSALSEYVAEARDLVAAVRDADALEDAYEQKLTESREIAKARRIQLGMYLRKVRDRLPPRAKGPNTGWMAFLEALEMSDTTAYRYMQEAGAVSGLTNPQSSKVGISADAYEDVPPPSDDDAPDSESRAAGHDVPDDPGVTIDRDAWCTPKWITDAIGSFDLDPCANERSHVDATYTYRLDRGEDGLKLLTSKWIDGASTRVFVNPPYSDVMPWVQAYKHTRFCFLVKLDPSTKWFAALYEHVSLILVPRGTRVEFEAPPGVASSGANPFPHGLFYACAADATDAIKNLCFTWRTK